MSDISNLLVTNYNPDVLECLANISSDEVFTPPKVVNEMLDMLPQELFRDPNTTFLDPATKSGVFLREITKRLIDGLADVIPDLQERVDHILHKQVFGIAMTELTSLMSRRSVYCSKWPNGAYSISHFDNAEGNIMFHSIPHTWRDGKCVYCGASQSEYDRAEGMETHAYEFIHVDNPRKIFGDDMKFDVVIGNPPYQLDTGTGSRQAIPIYNLFVNQAKRLQPRYLSMIIPSRWFAGGMGSLDAFRDNMLSDEKIRNMTDYPNSKDCFSGLSISGGVCYFLWDRDKKGDCEFTSVMGRNTKTLTRSLNEFPVLVRYSDAVSIIHKIRELAEECIDQIISPLMPFGLSTNARGTKEPSSDTDLRLYASDGTTFIDRSQITKGLDMIDTYKVMISKTSAEHAGEPSKDGFFRVLTSSMKVIGPREICTHSYFVLGNFKSKEIAQNALSYLATKFVRFLVLLSLTSINLSKLVFSFVPMQDFTKSWTDEELYQKYSLSDEEIEFIDSMIKPMDLSSAGGDEDA